MMKHFIKL